jgi:hypothetical protein
VAPRDSRWTHSMFSFAMEPKVFQGCWVIRDGFVEARELGDVKRSWKVFGQIPIYIDHRRPNLMTIRPWSGPGPRREGSLHWTTKERGSGTERAGDVLANIYTYEDQVHSMHQFQPVSWGM